MNKKVNQTAKAVMKKIKKGELKMKPKTYFVLGSMLLGAGLVGVLGLTVLLSGMIWFRLRMQGPVGFLRLGQPGLRLFGELFPWKIVGLSLVGLAGGSWLLKKYGKGYKVGIGWLVLGAVATVLGLGFLLDKAGVNDRFKRIESVKSLYEMRFRDENWIVGEVTEVGEGELMIVTPEGEEVTVKLTKETKQPVEEELKVGDKVRVVGKMTEGGFEADGVLPGGLRWNSPAPMRPGEGSEMGPGMEPGTGPGMGPGIRRMK